MNSIFSDRKRGSVLMVTVILSAIMAVVIGSFVRLAHHENRQANLAFYANNSLNLAEGGVEQALHALNYEDWGNWTQSGGVALMDPIELDLGHNQTGIIQVKIRNYENEPIVIAEGRTVLPNRPSVTKQVEVHLSRRSLFANGITSRRGARFSGGNAHVDSYSSSLGPPSSVNRNDNGSVASVSVETDAVDLSNSTIYGYVATGGSMPTVGPNGRIYGEDTPSGVDIDPTRIALDFASDFPEVEAPTAYHEWIPNINSTTFLGDATTDPDTPKVYRVGNIDLSGHASLQIVGPVVLHVTGNVHVRGNAFIQVASTGKAEFYIDNDFDIGGNGIVNATTTPANLLIYGTSPFEQNISLHGNATLQAAVYAPNANISMEGGGGSGTMAGAIVGNRVNITGNYRFHYDEDLAEFGPDRDYRMDHWREIHVVADRVEF